MKKHMKQEEALLYSPQAVSVREPSPDEGLTDDEALLRREHGLANTPVQSPTKTEKQIILQHSLTFFNCQKEGCRYNPCPDSLPQYWQAFLLNNPW